MPLSESICMMLNLAVNPKSEIQTEKIFLLQYIHLNSYSSDHIWNSQCFFPTPSCHFIIYYIKLISNYGLLWKTFHRDAHFYSGEVKELTMLLFSFTHYFSPVIKMSVFMISLIYSPVLKNYQSWIIKILLELHKAVYHR